jgi:LEA14-like dessication related protein
MVRVPMRTFFMGLAGSLVLAGCAAIPRNLQTPEVTFVGLRSIEASVFEQRLEVRLKVRNPNDIELPVNGLEVDVELAGEPFARGLSAREFVVPALGEAEFDMHVTANAAPALLRIAGGDRKSREIDYRLKGKLSTRIGMLRTIPFEQAGKLPISDLLGKKGKGN